MREGISLVRLRWPVHHWFAPWWEHETDLKQPPAGFTKQGNIKAQLCELVMLWYKRHSHFFPPCSLPSRWDVSHLSAHPSDLMKTSVRSQVTPSYRNTHKTDSCFQRNDSVKWNVFTSWICDVKFLFYYGIFFCTFLWVKIGDKLQTTSQASSEIQAEIRTRLNQNLPKNQSGQKNIITVKPKLCDNRNSNLTVGPHVRYDKNLTEVEADCS